MSIAFFLTLLTMTCAGYLLWGFRVLPREHWQIMAALPVRRVGNGPWQGVNLTWYGFFSANAYLAAVWIFLLLTGALGLSQPLLALFVAGLLGLCIPASRLVARLIEKKAHTLTVGGAVFVGLVASPWVLGLCNLAAPPLEQSSLPLLPVLAAMTTAYAFGEGLGRLACLSFGCCYGKPVSAVPPWLQSLLSPFAMRFFGATKKIAYAGHLEGAQVLPVQAMTAVLYLLGGVLGCALFLHGAYPMALIMTVTISQLWRVFSEFLRADFRGGGRLTAYQWMALMAVPYAWGLGFAVPLTPIVAPVIEQGLNAFWTPGILLTMQGLWLLIFFGTGRSAVTGATLEFHVHHERI